jgi:hypothetical protein
MANGQGRSAVASLRSVSAFAQKLPPSFDFGETSRRDWMARQGEITVFSHGKLLILWEFTIITIFTIMTIITAITAIST